MLCSASRGCGHGNCSNSDPWAELELYVEFRIPAKQSQGSWKYSIFVGGQKILESCEKYLYRVVVQPVGGGVGERVVGVARVDCVARGAAHVHARDEVVGQVHHQVALEDVNLVAEDRAGDAVEAEVEILEALEGEPDVGVHGVLGDGVVGHVEAGEPGEGPVPHLYPGELVVRQVEVSEGPRADQPQVQGHQPVVGQVQVLHAGDAAEHRLQPENI